MRKAMFCVGVALAVGMSGATDLCVKDGDTVAFLGDSITQFGNYPAGYVNMVMKGLEVLGVRDAKKIPAGISGHKSNDMLKRVDRDCLSKKPTFMTLSCGVNDVWHGPRGVKLPEYKANIAAILDKAAASNVTVIVLTPTMITEKTNYTDNVTLKGYCDWLREQAAARKLRLADLNADMVVALARKRAALEAAGRPARGHLLTCDGVHMAFDGNCMMAWGVLKAMGAAESDYPAVLSAWKKLPEAYKISVPLTGEEYDALQERAGRGSVSDLLHDSACGRSANTLQRTSNLQY